MHNNNQLITLGDANKAVMDVCKNRLVVVMLCFSFAFLLVTLRLLDVALLSGRVTLSQKIEVKDDMELLRAEIVDREGVLLAINLTTASLFANPQKVIELDESIKKITSVFPNMNKDDLKRKLTSKKNFVWIKRNLTPNQQHSVNALGIPGFYFRDEQKRIYPHSELFSHAIGYVGLDGTGLSGIEKSNDDDLKYYLGQDKKDSLQLSLDLRVQSIVREELQEIVAVHDAAGSSGVVMDVETGEVVAMVSLPDFNPHLISNQNKRAMFNMNTSGVYEMGSTFKTFTMAVALDNDKISFADEYDVTDPIRVANFRIKDFHPKRGMLSVSEIFIHSSNIGTAHIIRDVGIDLQKRFLKRIGVFSPLHIELPEKANSLYPKRWGDVHSITISYGHGIAVTPIHLVRAVSSIVNGGLYREETLLKSKKADILSGKRVIKADTSDKIRKLLRLAVRYGTGSRADVDGFLVGGKTGSADKAMNGKYEKYATIASFMGVFPMNRPKYAVFVMVDEPKPHIIKGGRTTGGVVAAPVVGNIIKRMAPVLNVSPVFEDQPEVKREFWFDNGKDRPKTYSF